MWRIYTLLAYVGCEVMGNEGRCFWCDASLIEEVKGRKQTRCPECKRADIWFSVAFWIKDAKHGVDTEIMPNITYTGDRETDGNGWKFVTGRSPRTSR